MNIIAAGDLKTLPGIELLLVSSAKYIKEPINWYILTGEMICNGILYRSLEEQQEYLMQLAQKYKFNLKLINCEGIYNKELYYCQSCLTGWPPYAAFRLFSHKSLPKDKYLYVDTDCIFLNNINSKDLEDADFYYATENLEEFCSAMLYFDTHNSKVLEDALKDIKLHEYKCPDSDALFHGIKTNLDICSNKLYKYVAWFPRDITDKTAVIHDLIGYNPEFPDVHIKIYSDENEFWEHKTVKNSKIYFLREEILQNRLMLDYKDLNNDTTKL